MDFGWQDSSLPCPSLGLMTENLNLPERQAGQREIPFPGSGGECQSWPHALHLANTLTHVCTHTYTHVHTRHTHTILSQPAC